MKARARFRIAALAAGALLVSCFDFGTSVAGGSSETTNGVVVGFVQHPDGSPAAGVPVSMRSQGFLADTSAEIPTALAGPPDTPGVRQALVYTDAQGRFEVDSILPGGYLFEARNPASGLAVLFSAGVGKGDTVVLPPKPMQPLAAIAGGIVPDGGDLRGYVRIFGLERMQRIDPESGGFAFRDLPQGIYSLEILPLRAGADRMVLFSVPAQSAETTFVPPVPLTDFENEDYATWPHSARLYLNTTSSGANVPGTVTDFPVLVRLNLGNFDFSQSDGRDIRFSGRNGQRLRYEVEQWDSAAGQASVWVRVDTIPGNSNSGFISMHWGKPGAPSWSNGYRVFDTATGFGGVWHLGEKAAGTVTDRLYRDATAANDHGDDRVAAEGTDGIIGMGQAFAPGDYVRIPGSPILKPEGSFTVSAWFKATSVDRLGAEIATMGQSYGIRLDERGAPVAFFSPGPLNSGSIGHGHPPMLDGTWHHVAARYDGSTVALFLDGREIARSFERFRVNYEHGPDFLLGRHGDGEPGFNFSGAIDEVRMARVPRSADWIKLSFENQRLNATLVEFRRATTCP